MNVAGDGLGAPGLRRCLGDRCGDNCCAHYPSATKGYVSVFGVPQGEIPLLESEAEALVAEGLGSRTHRLADGFMYLALNESGGCPFVTLSGLCERHDARFASCKAYPYFIDKYAGLVVDTTCPGVESGCFDVDRARESLDALAELMESRIAHLRATLGETPSGQDADHARL